jgi:hypothetical protein
MASILKEIAVNASAAAAWSKVADAGGVDKLVSMISACRLEGDKRYCTMVDGSEIVEQVIAVDHANRRLSYTITEGPLPFEFHCGSMQVHEAGSGARLVWTFDFKPDALADFVRPILDQASESITVSLG